MSDGNHSGSFCGNQNVLLKFLNQNGRQLRLYWVMGSMYTAGLRVCMAHAWGKW